MLFTANCFSQQIDWETEIDSSLIKASENNSSVFIYFGANWCAPCRIVEREVFQDSTFIEYSKELVMVKIYDDLRKGEFEKRESMENEMKKYNVDAIPTYILIKGNSIQKLEGMIYDSKGLIESIKNISNE